MANIRSAKKRIKTTEKKTKVNKSRMSSLKTILKKFDAAIENEEIEEAKELIKTVDKKLKKAVDKNLIHKNKASRELSRLTKQLNKAM